MKFRKPQESPIFFHDEYIHAFFETSNIIFFLPNIFPVLSLATVDLGTDNSVFILLQKS